MPAQAIPTSIQESRAVELPILEKLVCVQSICQASECVQLYVLTNALTLRVLKVVNSCNGVRTTVVG